MVVNSTTHFVDVAPYNESPKSYLELNGCTNFGGYTWVTVESSSCSSEATGLSSGTAGLAYSAARNAIAQGRLRPDASGMPLAAEEVKQLFRAAADDIDFSKPKPPGPANNLPTTPLHPGRRPHLPRPAGEGRLQGAGRGPRFRRPRRRRAAPVLLGHRPDPGGRVPQVPQRRRGQLTCLRRHRRRWCERADRGGRERLRARIQG